MGHHSLKFFLQTDYLLFKGNTAHIRVRDSLTSPEVSAVHTSTPELAHWVSFCEMEREKNLLNSSNSLIFCLHQDTVNFFLELSILLCLFGHWGKVAGTRTSPWNLINLTEGLNDGVCSLEALKPIKLQLPSLLYYQLAVPYKDILRETLHCVSDIKPVFIHWEKKKSLIYMKK